MIPNKLSIGPLSIHFYGLLIGLGVFAGLKVIEHIVSRQNLRVKSGQEWDGLVFAFVFGVVGARLYHVIDLWDYYSQHLGEIIAVWNGGLGIYGAMLGGGIGIWLFAKKKKLPLLELLDLAAIGLPLGQAIGRWGNFVNQELYGKPTQLPWGISIDAEHLLDGFVVGQRFHPLFLYESLGMLVAFFVLWKLRSKRRIGSGMFILVYGLFYGSIRFLLEPLRITSWSEYGMPVASIISVVIVVVSLGGLFYETSRRQA